jgi:dihydropteroate synthase
MKKCGFTINFNGYLSVTDRPLVMGIVNVTPDSFYDASRVESDGLRERIASMLADGADIIDVGACSTRPSGEFVSEQEELRRMHTALDIIDNAFPKAVVSVDTFRASVVRECVARHNVAIINDVSGYDWDENMLDAVADARRAYVLTHSGGRAGEEPHYANLVPDVLKTLGEKLWQLRQRGVNDVIVDPGFGFAKSLDDNYELFAHLQEFEILNAPLLVGVSRKSMITKVLGCEAKDALNGTTALNCFALAKGADILRVHDVKEAVQAVTLYTKMVASKNV